MPKGTGTRTEFRCSPSAAHMVVALAFAEQRRFPEALAAIQKAYQIDPNPTVWLVLAQVQAASGNRVEAERLV